MKLSWKQKRHFAFKNLEPGFLGAEVRFWPQIPNPATEGGTSTKASETLHDTLWSSASAVDTAKTRQGVFTLGDSQSFLGLTSKIPPLRSMLNFDADVKTTLARHQCENPFNLCMQKDQRASSVWSLPELHTVEFPRARTCVRLATQGPVRLSQTMSRCP